jgi:hypothetical protein
VAVGQIPVVEVDLRHQVYGVREGRNPVPVLQARVPAGVVQVQVGVDDHVYLLRGDACGSQVREEAGVQVRERGQRPVLPVAGPGVDEDGLPFAAQHPGLQRADISGEVGVHVVGLQPRPVLPPQLNGNAGRDVPGRGSGVAVVLHHPGDGNITELDFLHTSSTGCGPDAPSL